MGGGVSTDEEGSVLLQLALSPWTSSHWSSEFGTTSTGKQDYDITLTYVYCCEKRSFVEFAWQIAAQLLVEAAVRSCWLILIVAADGRS